MKEKDIIKYVDPVFKFCCKRISNKHDAEDLASEIMLYVLDVLNKYVIKSLDSWIWRIAHNRYARFINDKNKNPIMLFDNDTLFDIADYTEVDEESTKQQFEAVFKNLHTLSSEYRNIFVDHYIDGMSIRSLAKKYSLPETTIKWRLNIGRIKIKNRVGENKMDKIYKRTNWNTYSCNGNMNSNKYLFSQVARAICLACYEKPLTIDEISIKTGIPALYIEDELPRLEYGDAICKVGNKYATDFIIFSLDNRKEVECASSEIIEVFSDYFEMIFNQCIYFIENSDFYGKEFGIERLGYFIVPYLIRNKIENIKNNHLNLKSGPFPPRKDGGYGWFIVEETADIEENSSEYESGCNIAIESSKSLGIYYYWIGKYFENDIYHGIGTRFLCSKNIVSQSKNGVFPKNLLCDEDAVMLIKNNLISKCSQGYKLNFACFSQEQFQKFISHFNIDNGEIDRLLSKWILSIHKSFTEFVPKRLHDQINQWISSYLNQLIGYVSDELIRRGVLKKPHYEKPLTDGIFCILDGNINP